MTENYDILFQKEIEEINKTQSMPSLLLHVCCAPCSSAVLERLSKYFSITIYYYNPNIHPQDEYERRLEELKMFLEKCNNKNIYGSNKITFLSTRYEPMDYFKTVETNKYPHLKTEKECGERCSKCYKLRIKDSAFYAKTHNFDYFTTALSISPHKDAKKINELGEKIEKELQENNPEAKTPKYLFADFKKHDGFKRSLELSKEFNLYRQDYCGCIYSQMNMKRFSTQ